MTGERGGGGAVGVAPSGVYNQPAQKQPTSLGLYYRLKKESCLLLLLLLQPVTQSSLLQPPPTAV